MIVVDASAIAAALVDREDYAGWIRARLRPPLAAPGLLPYEVASVLRRLERERRLDAGHAAQAHADLLALPVELWPYRVTAARAHELRGHLSSYDASYVALAELLDAPLITLDRRLAAAPGIGCPVLVPPAT